MKLYAAVLAALCGIAAAQVCTDTPTCTPEECQVPDCACSNSEPDIPLEERPQLVYLTFDDGFTALSEQTYYSGLFDGTYLNPNGCPIRATHYLTHLSTDYSLVHKYWTMGHEMAAHSITHRSNTTYWATLSTQEWIDEMGGMKTMISKFSKIPPEYIKGMRSPFLQGGGDAQFAMMIDQGFEYDCTMPSRVFGYANMANGMWPFSMDYRSELDCQIEPCPTCSYPGIWVQPILDLDDAWLGSAGDPDHGSPCGMLDSCICNACTEPEQIFEMMKKNFDRSYNGNTRAPIGIYVHAAWFFGDEFHYEGYKQFVEYVLSFNDTWIVPVEAGIRYRINPVPVSELLEDNFEPFKCDNFPAFDCNGPISCKYQDVDNEDISVTEVYMKTCVTCPLNYPWLGNPEGN